MSGARQSENTSGSSSSVIGIALLAILVFGCVEGKDEPMSAGESDDTLTEPRDTVATDTGTDSTSSDEADEGADTAETDFGGTTSFEPADETDSGSGSEVVDTSQGQGDTDSTSEDKTDKDSDGWHEPWDCDDGNPDVNPGREELYDPPNGIDDDCDGKTDEAPVTQEDGPIEPDCSGCPAVGELIENMRCAIDLCDDATVVENEYGSPGGAVTDQTYVAVHRFGSQNNGLEPLYNGSYALMGTGRVLNTDDHMVDLSLGKNGQTDPFGKGDGLIFDVMEWRMRLRAPATAAGFQVHYVFFSAEYDDYIGDEYNDKFYMFIEAPSTNGGARTVINFTECRNPDAYHDFLCDGPSMGYCDQGHKYCYIAINTALSECCWYDGCPDGFAATDIAGTGFECAQSETDDLAGHGSSTGWLVTEWPVEPGEEFEIIFHIHDTGDGLYDSAVLLDKFLFMGQVTAGTKPL